MRRFCAVLLLAIPVGCVNTDVIVQRQGEMERRLEAVAHSGAIHSQRTDDLSAQLAALQQSRQQDREELEALRGAIQGLRSEMALLAQARPSDVSRIEVVNREPVGESGPPEGYVKAFGLFSASDYAGAIEGFENFIRTSPRSEYAGNARYWIGECHFARKEYSKALAAFKSVVDDYAGSSKVPDAMLKAGYALLSLNEPAQGRTMLEELIRTHPSSQAAVRAKERLNTINGSAR